jgi:hypothetical protein
MKGKRALFALSPALGLGLLLTFGGGAALAAPPEGSPATGKNPFAYPPRILKEMAAGKAPGGKEVSGPKSPQREYSLSGVLWTEKGGVASINRRILREGEMLDEYRVARIEPNKVILKKEGEEIVLNLFQSPVVITEHREQRSTKKKSF